MLLYIRIGHYLGRVSGPQFGAWWPLTVSLVASGLFIIASVTSSHFLAVGQNLGDADFEGGQKLFLEPRIALHPEDVSGAGVRQGNEMGPGAPPVPHGLGDGLPFRLGEVVGQRVLSEKNGQLDVWQVGEKLGSPGWGALGPGREVAAFGVGSGVAEAHREQGDLRGVVEGLRSDAEPGAEALPAGVVEGNAGLVDFFLPGACPTIRIRADESTWSTGRGP